MSSNWIVDYPLRAPRLRRTRHFPAPRLRPHLAQPPPPQLDGVRTDIPSRTQYHDCLTGDGMRVVEKHLPCGYRHDGHGGRFDVAQAGGLARNHFGGADCVLGVPSAELGIGDAINRVAFLNSTTPGPVAYTTPDRSEPALAVAAGSPCFDLLADNRIPWSHLQQRLLAPAVRLPPERGEGMSSTTMTSGGLNVWMRAAFIYEFYFLPASDACEPSAWRRLTARDVLA